MHINFEIRYASAFAHVRKNSAIFIIILTYKYYLIRNYQFFSSEIIYLTILVSVEPLFGSGRSVCVYRALCLIFPFLEIKILIYGHGIPAMGSITRSCRHPILVNFLLRKSHMISLNLLYFLCKPEFLFNKYCNLQKHQSECLLKVVECPNSGCSEKLTKQDMKTHVTSECSWRKINCEYCREPFVFNQKQVCRYPYK